MQAAAAGRDPCSDKRESRRAEKDSDSDLIAHHVETFLARHVRPKNKAKTIAETERRFNKYILPRWGERSVQEIRRRDVIGLLDAIVDQGAPVSANRVLSLLKTFFSFLVDRSVIEQSPTHGVRAPTAEASRDRVLSDDEVRWLWMSADQLGTPYGRFAQMLLLTAQRRDEVAGMRRSELKGTDLWTISRERMKGGVPHDVPLASQAARVLEGIPRVHGSDYVFTLSGDGPITGYSEAKRRLDGKILEIAREDARGRGEAPPEAIPRWTFHDLRRTAASGMAQLGTPVHVIEAVLAHRGGEISGVAGIYNKWNYLPEKSKALAAWARYLESLVSGEPASNVVELHSA